MEKTLVHHHLIYQARVTRNDLGENAGEVLRKFLYDLCAEIQMNELIPAQLKFSKNRAWTGLLGIVTSHISFHYWTVEKYVQLDIYSCKSFDRKKAIEFIDAFWAARDVKALFIDREFGGEFKIERK